MIAKRRIAGTQRKKGKNTAETTIRSNVMSCAEELLASDMIVKFESVVLLLIQDALLTDAELEPVALTLIQDELRPDAAALSVP